MILAWIIVSGADISLAQPHGASGHGSSPVQMETVVVTAAQLQGYLENHPQQVTVMTREQIQQGRYTDLTQVLNAMPGVEVKPSGSGLGSRISIRGSGSGGKILVLINGRPVNSTQYGGINLGDISLDTVARVDVFKPPVPVWLGPGSSAGAINILLANPSAEDQAGKKTTRVGITGGSFGKAGLTASRLLAINEHQLRLSASGTHKDGHRTNSDSDSGSVNFQWDLPSGKETTFDVNGRYYQSEHGTPGPLHNLTPDARQTYRKGALDIRMQGSLGETGENDLKTYMDITRLKDTSQSGLISTLDALSCGVKNETSWHATDNTWALRMTSQLARERIDHTLSGDHQREQVALGLQGDHTFETVIASLGARCDYTSDYRFQPAADAGVNVPLGSSSRVKLNAGYSVNVPTFSQLYQPSHGSIDQVRGNPDLKEERVWTVSTGISHRLSKERTLEVTLFYENTDHKIAYQEGADRIKRPVNIDKAYRRGIETVVNWELASTADIDLSYVWQQTCNRENDKELTYAPAHTFKVSLNWTLPSTTRTETTITRVSRVFSDLENSPGEKVDGYTTVDLKLIQPIPFQHYHPELFVHFENLLDEAYEVHYGYPDAGFRVTAGLNLDF